MNKNLIKQLWLNPIMSPNIISFFSVRFKVGYRFCQLWSGLELLGVHFEGYLRSLVGSIVIGVSKLQAKNFRVLSFTVAS